jgi:hypothetical protein
MCYFPFCHKGRVPHTWLFVKPLAGNPGISVVLREMWDSLLYPSDSRTAA